jgi:hypothetical protein
MPKKAKPDPWHFWRAIAARTAQDASKLRLGDNITLAAKPPV